MCVKVMEVSYVFVYLCIVMHIYIYVCLVALFLSFPYPLHGFNEGIMERSKPVISKLRMFPSELSLLK